MPRGARAFLPVVSTRVRSSSVALLLALTAFSGAARADTVENDIASHNGNDRIRPGGSLTVAYSVAARDNDQQAGCNAADGTPLTLWIQPSSAAVQASPSSLTFTSCGAAQEVVLSSDTVGNYRIGLETGDAGGGRYFTGGATFTLHVAEPEPEGAPADATPPIIDAPSSLTVEATGPGGAAASWTATATDDVDGPVDVACAPPSGSLFPLGETIVECAASDAAGNVAAAAFPVAVVDTTPPSLALPSAVSAYATSGAGGPASWTASAWDLVDEDVDVACDAASGAAFAPGRTTVTCEAVDAAGNAARGSFVVWVTFEWCGFKQPVSPGGPASFRLGSSIPVKFCLGGGVTDAVARLHVSRLPGGAESAAASTSSSSPTQFRYADGQYVFNMATGGLAAGSYQLRVDLGDGTTRTATVTLR